MILRYLYYERHHILIKQGSAQSTESSQNYKLPIYKIYYNQDKENYIRQEVSQKSQKYSRNQTEIQNHFKRKTFEKTMIIYNITDNKVYNLSDLIGERIHEGVRCVYIHVTRDKNVLRIKQSNESRNIVIDGCQTYVIPD